VTLSGLAAENLTRNRLRTLLTAAAVAVAVVAFVFLRTALAALNARAESASKERIFTRDEVSVWNTVPKRYADDVQHVDGVQYVTWVNWFGGVVPGREHEFFGSLAVDPAHYFDVYNDLAVSDPKALETWRADRQGVIVGKKLAQQFGWKVGDAVVLKSQVVPGDWQFHIAGLYEPVGSQDPRQFLLHWEYYNDGLPPQMHNQLGWVISRIKPGASTATLTRHIDDMFSEREAATISQEEGAFTSSFMGMFSAVLNVLNLVCMVTLATMMLILGNTVAMGVRERTHEYGVLRAVGFLPEHLSGLVVGEAAVLGALGAAGGLAFVWAFINYAVGPWVAENMSGMGLMGFRVQPDLAALAFVLAVGLAMLAAAIPAWRVGKLRVVDALRRVA
jgi:putative ABC transport system permease protein